MKKYRIFGIATIVILLVIVGYVKNQTERGGEDEVKTVAVLELKEESRPLLLHYTGTIVAKEIKEYSFKSSGRIAEVFVEEGQAVKEGDKLALLELEEIRLTELEMEKAGANYDFVKDYYEKAKKLYESGGLSQLELQEAELKMEQAEYSLEQAQKTLELSRKNALITADSDGYVISVPGRKNEVTAAGVPVVVAGSKEGKGRIGLIREDAAQVKAGDEVAVWLDNTETKGEIITVGKIPDPESRTYTMDITLDKTLEEKIGALIKVTITTGLARGIWLPVTYILNDGEDYVFVAQEKKARRKNVEITGMLDDMVCVKGLEDGDQLITEGFKSVKDGYEIAVIDNGSVGGE